MKAEAAAMIVAGKSLPNITCKRCKQRHPIVLSCAQAEVIALRARIATLEADNAELRGLVQTWREVANARG